MKKRIISLLIVMLLIIPVIPVTATELPENTSNLDNRTFESIDGEEVSIQSEGKPKVLVFFKPDCWNCRNTLKSIANSEWLKEDKADVCALELSQKSADDVRQFREDYCGSDSKIKFVADSTYGVNSMAFRYLDLGEGEPVTPIIAIVDADNNLRFLNTGNISADAIEEQYLSVLFAEADSNPDADPDEGETEEPEETPEENETQTPEETPGADEAETPEETPSVDETETPEEISNAGGAGNTTEAAETQVKPSNTEYADFLNKTANTILHTKQQEVVINTKVWVSFNRTVFEAIKSRPDVTVIVNYMYKGKPYTLKIPAGTDVSTLMDENGFGGFRYIEKVLNTK